MAISTQILFWVVINAILVMITHLVIRAVAVTYTDIVAPPLLPILGLSSLTGIFYGTALALIDVRVDRRSGAASSVGRKILIKALLYTVVFIGISLVTLSAFEHLMHDWFARLGMEMTDEAMERWGYTFIPTTLVGNFLVSFIKQVSRSFGPGMLLSMLLGRYREPVRERRVFMFMDLKSSTRHAEELGPERYSSMIRDLFHDVDTEVPKHEAEIYQYVGDEVVFTWNADDLLDKQLCVRFYFAIERAIGLRADHYQAAYDRIPTFKAGLHIGDVIAVEVGDIKRDIAYHGDTINTAARIQSMCNEMGSPFIISDSMLEACAMDVGSGLRTKELGAVLLRGKQNHVAVHAVLSNGARNAEPLSAAAKTLEISEV